MQDKEGFFLVFFCFCWFFFGWRGGEGDVAANILLMHWGKIIQHISYIFLFFFQHSSLVTEEEKELLLSDFWGPFLVDMPRKNQDSNIMMNTFWGDVISRYSDITVPSLEYLAGLQSFCHCYVQACHTLS